MGRRLSLNLTHMQVRTIHEDATVHEADVTTPHEERQRWAGIAREAKRALAFHERTTGGPMSGTREPEQP